MTVKTIDLASRRGTRGKKGLAGQHGGSITLHPCTAPHCSCQTGWLRQPPHTAPLTFRERASASVGGFAKLSPSTQPSSSHFLPTWEVMRMRGWRGDSQP